MGIEIQLCWPIQISPLKLLLFQWVPKDPNQRELTEQIYNNFIINKIEIKSST